MNTLINTLFNDIHRITPSKRSCVKESGDVYTSEIELPGFSKKDMAINVADDILTVTAKNKDREKEFKLYLNNLVSVDHITADLKYGLLKLIPKFKPTNRPRPIAIKE